MPQQSRPRPTSVVPTMARDKLNEITADVVRARTVQDAQMNAWRRVAEQALRVARSAAKTTAAGDGTAPGLIESEILAATEAADRMHDVLSMASRHAAEAAYVADGILGEEEDEAARSARSIEQLREMTFQVGGGEMFERAIHRTLATLATQRSQSGFASYSHGAWPARHTPFVSFAQGAAPPFVQPTTASFEASERIFALPTTELRAFLHRLFTEECARVHAELHKDSTDMDASNAVAAAARDVAELPDELVKTLAQALDRNGDGLIEEQQLCAMWLWLLDSDSRLTRVGSIVRLAHEAGADALTSSRSPSALFSSYL